MRLMDYLDGMRSASSADELEAAIQAPFPHRYIGPTWSRICNVRIQRGREICDAHPLGRFVPRFTGRGRELALADETYRVGKGYNSTGVRYCWHDAEMFSLDVLSRNGFSKRAASKIWDRWSDYPHRCLSVIQKARSGELPDPPLNRLLFAYNSTGPVRLTAAQNASDDIDPRASRPCRCGGTRFDWGAGYSGYLNYINWHCNGCRRVYVEYMDTDRLCQLRARKSAA